MSLFSPHASWKTLSLWCRSLGTMLHSGVNLIKALEISGGQTSDRAFGGVIRAVIDDLRQGEDIATSLKNQGTYFPELVTDMVQVAEHTGALPEVLKSLADHYENLLRLRKMFLSQIAWPVFQLLMAIFIIAGLIFILGLLPTPNLGSDRIDITGLGLFGGVGALTWLGYCFGTAIVVWMLYQFLVRGLQLKGRIDGILLRIPVIGDCLRSFAVARFAWAYALTQQAGMDIQPSLNASLKATSNGAFINAAPQIVMHVMEGEDLTEACEATGLFPMDVIEMMRVGETSGTVPETLQHLGPQFEERARRALATLTMAFAGLIWMLVAGIVIYFIFRLFFLFMYNPLQDALKGV